MPRLTCQLDRPFDEHPRLRLDCFALDEEAVDSPLVVCLHHDWAENGVRQDCHPLCLRLAAAGHATAALGFRRLRDVSGRELATVIGDVLVGIERSCEEALLCGVLNQGYVLCGIGSGAALARAVAARIPENRPPPQALVAYGGPPASDRHAWPTSLAVAESDALHGFDGEAPDHPTCLIHGPDADPGDAAAIRIPGWKAADLLDVHRGPGKQACDALIDWLSTESRDEVPLADEPSFLT